MDEQEDLNPTYELSKLNSFLINNGWKIKKQFVVEENILFIQIQHIYIVEPILIYFPSKYIVLPDEELSEIVEILSEEISDEERLKWSLNILDDEKEINIGEDFKPIETNLNTRNDLIGSTIQLNRWKNFFTKTKWKIGVLTNNSLVSINRHNEVDIYLLKSKEKLISQVNIGGNKHDIVHDLLFVIDLPNFYEKMEEVRPELIKLQRTLYENLNTMHAKHIEQFQLLWKMFPPFIKMINLYKTTQELFLLYTKGIKNYTESLEKLEKFENTNRKQHAERINSNTIDILKSIQRRYNDLILKQDVILQEIYKHTKIIENLFETYTLK